MGKKRLPVDHGHIDLPLGALNLDEQNQIPHDK
jgi:hypothetical protein